ncbi:MAG: phosphate regulon sensor histidine kinase PhoR [Allorhizobium sp.]
MHVKNERLFWQDMVVRAAAGWAYLAAATMIAVAAVALDTAIALTAGLWVLAVVVVLSRKPPQPASKAAAVSEPEAIVGDGGADVILETMRATLGALDLPVFVFGREAIVLFQNKAAEKVFGPFQAGQHISARWRSPGILDMIRETLATDQPNQIEHSERLPSETVYIIRSAPLDLPPALVRGNRYYVMSLRDISELRRLDRMRSDFVANASHELRTPLASLRGFIETMQGPARNDEKARERFLGIMLEQATRMSRLVDDLLSLSRLELKAHLAPDQMVDLVPVIGHVRDSLAPLADELDVAINLHMPEGKVDVVGDRDELVQVFENLIENACKYGQEGKVVDVFVVNDPGQPVEVRIRDHGPGIPSEHVPRLTERFYRVSVADSRSKKGTGLGLAIVKHILTRHRARMLVRSEIGKGTEFTVRF